MSEICIIGDRKAGKTTYLATLLRCPDRLKLELPGLEVAPTSDDADELADLARAIIEEGRNLAPTDREREYNLHIKVPGVLDFDMVATDYAGELIGTYAAIPKERHKLKSYLPNLLSVNGWLIMITDWELRRDQSIYEPAFKYLLNCLADECSRNTALRNIRIAVVLNKCERGELWPCRLDPEYDFFRLRLRRTHAIFRRFFPSPDRLQFFACSSFGILGDTFLNQDHHRAMVKPDPRPNYIVSQDGANPEARAGLKDPKLWKPFGLISPLYWLKTGRRLKHEWV